nr:MULTISPECIES: adenosine deaminase [unclassified Fusibacter]
MQVDKSDLHNHSTRGGNKRYIEQWTGASIEACPKMKSLDEMNVWYQKNIKILFSGRIGYEKRIDAAFIQAEQDGVKELHMSVGIGEEAMYGGSVSDLVENMKRAHLQYAPKINFAPEIAWSTYDDYDLSNEKLDEFLATGYFKSFDMYGCEEEVPTYKELFRKVKRSGLILKAHVGEFGSAELVQRAVEELELDQVQHGIAVANSPKVMNWLRDHRIQLNVCPTSNVLLSRVAGYETHPIKKLYEHGVRVTINSDDMLIFDQSVSQEYLNLYRSGNLDVEALNLIRKYGLGY